MEEITLGQLLQAVNGTLLGPFQNTSAIIQKVDTDSRNMHPGSLFIPLVGDPVRRPRLYQRRPGERRGGLSYRPGAGELSGG